MNKEAINEREYKARWALKTLSDCNRLTEHMIQAIGKEYNVDALKIVEDSGYSYSYIENDPRISLGQRGVIDRYKKIIRKSLKQDWDDDHDLYNISIAMHEILIDINQFMAAELSGLKPDLPI